MFKRLLSCIREYRLPTILTLIFITGEVVIEVFIPFITADLVNRIEEGAVLGEIIKIGLLLLVMALLSLTCGGIAGLTCAKASAGF
ncbi:MAG: ABC transporter ATP-binding protein, partial [Clostridia bacterium]|nr:ABC transporter ATP-binding protein [Clostridia bacterium]